MQASSAGKLESDQLDDLVAQADTGARAPDGLAKIILLSTALCWSLFQLYYASPLPFYLSEVLGVGLTLNDTEARCIHLGFAIFLAFTAYPAYLHRLSDFQRHAAVLMLFVGGGVTIWGIRKYASIEHDLSTIGVWFPVLATIITVLSNPLLRRKWGKNYQFLGKLLTFAGLAGLIYWLKDFTLLEDVVGEKLLKRDIAIISGGLGLFLLSYPGFETPSRLKISVPDWSVAIIAAFCASYLFWFYEAISDRQGLPTYFDLVVTVVGMLCLLEATRRALGPPLMVVAILFLAYTFLGPYMPELIAHKGASLSRVASHQWLTTEGVFGIAVGVSTKFVFLFVLFGSLLDKAGAGNYFIKVAFALLGHLRGGPAKAAVAASGMTGLISGSSIANVVTTGTFTIPLMKRVGFTGEKAGAVEVASSVNGQLMPPVMGAAAFLMIEYVGMPYTEVIKHAFLPAIISYIALLYIVHLEALKANMQSLEKPVQSTFLLSMIRAGIIICSIIILSGVIYYGIGWLKAFSPDYALYIIMTVVFTSYIALVSFGAKYPELEVDDPNKPVVELPMAGPTIKVGIYFLLPIIILVWCLMVERMSPGLSAFWATVFLMFVVLTQRPLNCFFRKRQNYLAETLNGFCDLFNGLIAGARNMIGIGVATAAAGIIVGTVSLTGIGFVMTEFVEFLSGGNLVLMLVFTAIISLILGMGLPTTANYIVVSTLMAPVIVTLGANSGLIVPLIAVHLFVFYFGIMADVTPPVGLASFAAAAVSGADPIKTGVTAFFYSLRTVALPFIFIFNTQLLLIGIDGSWHLMLTVASAIIAMLVFAAATQGYFFSRNKVYETVALLLIAFTLFRPGFWMDMIHPEYNYIVPKEASSTIENLPSDSSVRVVVKGDKFGEIVETTKLLPLGPSHKNDKVLSGSERLEHAGLMLRSDQEKVVVDNVMFGSPAEKAGIDFDWEILRYEIESDRPMKELFFIPALLLLMGIVTVQRRRNKTSAASSR